MILSPIPAARLDAVLAAYAASLPADSRPVFTRFADARNATRASGVNRINNGQESIYFISSFAIAIRPGSPRLDWSWNGESLGGGTEAYVLLHELAHWQLALPARRRLIDFGLGPGPETGDIESAKRVQCIFGLEREREEAMALLLGILWETELGHPALASFLDQNWLEGAPEPARLPGAAAHFAHVLGMLRTRGLVDRAGRPRRHGRRERDARLGRFVGFGRVGKGGIDDVDRKAALERRRLAAHEPLGQHPGVRSRGAIG
jgi:hypothetical protein